MIVDCDDMIYKLLYRVNLRTLELSRFIEQLRRIILRYTFVPLQQTTEQISGRSPHARETNQRELIELLRVKDELLISAAGGTYSD